MLIVFEKMILRWRYMTLLVLVVSTLAQDHPGLVEKDSEQDLIAEATILGAQAQKREAGLSNSYGEPLPADVYGPPKDIGSNIISDISLPAPIYGVPVFQNTPAGAYGPPSPVFPNQNYEGPPPPPSKPKPVYGLPKSSYGPPKSGYGPPKPIYGPPKKSYGPPKLGLPKLNYGAPFKPPKLNFPKPIYGVPKPVYGPPKQIYGPPKSVYGPPKNTQIHSDLPSLPDLPSINVHQNIPIGSDFSNVNVNVGSNIDLGLDLPAPIYGTPFPNLPHDMKPNFPLPSETYGPPGQPLGPAGSNDQILIQDIGNFHYGPPQPDPNPRPPHPGIPAPPTPPHVLYDGWKPIPGISKPIGDHGYKHIGDQYGPPPPPPQKLNFDLNFDGLTLPNLNSPPQFSGAQINTGYSNVKHDIHHDALANIDLNAIVGGDSNHIDQSKTVFEAHYTEPAAPSGNLILQNGPPSGFDKPFDSYGAPPLESLSNGPYPQSFRSHGAKELPHQPGHGISLGNHYGPPKPPSANLPIPYGSVSGGGHSIHTGGSTPRHPIKFREPVPDGLIQQIGYVSHHKDVHPNDHLIQGPAYLPPPIRDVKDVNQHSGNPGLNSISLSIEPSNLYSLPHSGNPISFQNHGQSQPSNLYGSPIDSYSVPLLTVGDHTASGSNTNAVTATIDGTILANLSNLDAAAILKHCPYHEEILKAARTGGKISPELASSYIASLSSLGTAFQKNHQFLNGLKTDNELYKTKDLSTASHTLVQSVIPGNDFKKEQSKGSIVKGKSVKHEQNYDQDDLQFVSQQIFQTSEKIKNLSDETKELQQKIVSANRNIKGKYSKDITNGKVGGYAVQISSSEGKSNQPTIPHDQLLSEGLLQSILHAIEQPGQEPNQIINGQNINQQNINQYTSQSNQAINFNPASMIDLRSLGSGGIDLPAGYEPVDRTKEKKHDDQDIQASNKDLRQILNNEIVQKNKDSHTDCDLRADNSIRHVVVVPPPGLGAAETKPVDEVEDNDVAIYFDQPSTDSKEKVEPVTEISVATSISEEIDNTKDEVTFGDKIDKKET